MNFLILCKSWVQTHFARPKIGLAMKLTAVLLLACALQVAANGLAQKVTISKENAPLKSVFEGIKKQTGYSFFYPVKLLENTVPVTINMRNAELEDVLKEVLKNQPLTYQVVNKTIVIRPNIVRQLEINRKDTVPGFNLIRGMVTDETTNDPIEGASVTIVGTKGGAPTNKLGKFEMAVPKGGSILVSSVGYESKTIRIDKSGDINISLKLNTAKDPMANVVVTGYTQINKESFTGNAVVMTGDELKRVNPQNVLAAVSAFDPSFRIAENTLLGSNPNRLPNISVRGSTSLPSGSGDVLNRNNLSSNINLPTFILDGYEVSLEKVYDLDVNRIQTVTLLKDAAATAIYGSRAANGVLVITTKLPKEGKLQVFYNYEANVSGPDLTVYDVLNAEEKLEYERLAGLYEAVGERTSEMQEQLYYTKKRAVVSGVNTYWLSQPVRTAVGHKHSLFIEGGNSTIRYGLDLRYQTMPGVMKGSTRDRYSVGMSLSYNPSKKFLFRNTLTVAEVNSQESPYGNFIDYVRMNPYYPKTDSLGKVEQAVERWLVNTNRQGSDQFRTEVALNPLYNSTLSSFNKTTYLEIIDAFSGEWTITHGLRLRALASLTKRQYDGDIFASPLSNEFFFYGTEDLVNRGRYTATKLEETAFDGNATLSYNRGFGMHFFNATLGTNIRTYLSDMSSFAAIGFSNDRFTNVGFANRYEENTSPIAGIERERLIGSFFSVNYSFDNKYLLDASVRADGSSKFGAEKKVAPFWAVGIGWNVHKEDVFRNTSISTLRLRASTGLTGAVSFPPYMSKTMYSYFPEWYATGVGAIASNYGNEQLQWQRTRNYDIGADIGLFKDRIIISPRYYYKLTRGLLADIFLPPSTGFTSYKDNLGDMENTGYELNLKYSVIQNKNWSVNLTANLVNNENKIVRISNALKAYNDKADEEQVKDDFLGVPLLRYNEGQSLNTIYAVRSLGIDPENGREIFIKRDGTQTYTWNVRDIVPVGETTPVAEGFFGGNISYKGFLVNILFFTRLGGQEYNQTLVDRVENADPRYNVDRRVLEQRWRNPGDKALYKNIADLGTTNASDRFVQRDNVLELRTIYCSYDFNKSFYSRLGMNNLRVAVTANDIWRKSSMKIERGIDYPFARSITFSLQTNF